MLPSQIFFIKKLDVSLVKYQICIAIVSVVTENKLITNVTLGHVTLKFSPLFCYAYITEELVTLKILIHDKLVSTSI